MDLFLWIGLIGQGFFSIRFFVQWIASEKAGESIIPVSFWFFSILGSGFLLIYAVYRKDPVFVLGQAPNLLIYSRNLYLIRKEKRKRSIL